MKNLTNKTIDAFGPLNQGTRTMKNSLKTLVTITASLSLASLSQAAVISINFPGDRSGAAGPDVTATAGYVPVGNWNNASGVSGTLSNLNDDSGNNSGASVSWQTFNLWDLQNGDGFGGDRDLMSGYLDNIGASGPSDTITITDVPYKNYDVFVYFNRAAGTTYTGLTASDGFNTDTLYAKDTGAAYPLGGGSNGYIISTDDTVDGTDASWTAANVIQFTGFTGSTLNIDDPSNPGAPSGPGLSWKVYVQGIQIQDTSVPEPSSLLLLGLGALGLMRHVRRRRRRA